MQSIPVLELKVGQTLMDGKVKIKKIEHNACSAKGTHVNNSQCHDPSQPVLVSSV